MHAINLSNNEAFLQIVKLPVTSLSRPQADVTICPKKTHKVYYLPTLSQKVKLWPAASVFVLII